MKMITAFFLDFIRRLRKAITFDDVLRRQARLGRRATMHMRT